MQLGIIAKINEVIEHPNADRLALGNVAGNTVIVGLDIKEGDIGIYFCDDLQLSTEYMKQNDLLPVVDENGKRIGGGYFDINGRVRRQKFRGVKSDGFWMPIKSLEFTGANLTDLKIGDQIGELNGVKICEKYFTKATREHRTNGVNKQKKREPEILTFHKHFDTPQFRFMKDDIKKGDIIWITEKLHGTSARSGRALVEDSKYKGWFGAILDKIGLNPKIREWRYVCGSRNAIIKDESHFGFHGNESWRIECHNNFVGKLEKGETVYYEIVGYTHDAPIMGKHEHDALKNDKEFIKQFGNGPTVYSYGCPIGTREIYVYRISKCDEDGIERDYPFDQVIRRCSELGVKHVPVLFGPKQDNDDFVIEDVVQSFTDSCSVLDNNIHKEGVCIRYEGRGKFGVFKNKSYYFGVLEGYIKNNDDYVDTEEIS